MGHVEAGRWAGWCRDPTGRWKFWGRIPRTASWAEESRTVGAQSAGMEPSAPTGNPVFAPPCVGPGAKAGQGGLRNGGELRGAACSRERRDIRRGIPSTKRENGDSDLVPWASGRLKENEWLLRAVGAPAKPTPPRPPAADAGDLGYASVALWTTDQGFCRER